MSRGEQLQSLRRRHLSIEGHRKIYDAIRTGDASGAAARMREHVSQVAALIAPGSTGLADQATARSSRRS